MRPPVLVVILILGLVSGCTEDSISPPTSQTVECKSSEECKFFNTATSKDNPCPACLYASSEWTCVTKDTPDKPDYAACEPCASVDWDEWECKCVSSSCYKVEKRACDSAEECSDIDCSIYDKPVKSGYAPDCVEGFCTCMCYGCA